MQIYRNSRYKTQEIQSPRKGCKGLLEQIKGAWRGRQLYPKCKKGWLAVEREPKEVTHSNEPAADCLVPDASILFSQCSCQALVSLAESPSSEKNWKQLTASACGRSEQPLCSGKAIPLTGGRRKPVPNAATQEGRQQKGKTGSMLSLQNLHMLWGAAADSECRKDKQASK
ncbi:hypothetical protein HispidOSU_025737 [Sigmodon hispidus]